MSKSSTARVLWCLLACSVLVGCGSDKPLAPFEPQVNNAANTFQLQATSVNNVTSTQNYPWQNDGTTANVDQSTTVTKGSATLTIFDANDVQVYTRDLAENGSFTSSAGVASSVGNDWTIRLTLVGYSGTLNFRVQKP